MNTSSNNTTKNWHVAQWPPLAWAETVIKVIALTIAILGTIRALSAGAFAFPTGLRLAQLIVQVILALGLVAAIFDRLIEREIIAMAFVILNNLGHWGMALALATTAAPGAHLSAFAALMLLGDLVKLVFLKVHNFRVRDTPLATMYGLTLFYVAGYAVLLILQAFQ